MNIGRKTLEFKFTPLQMTIHCIFWILLLLLVILIDKREIPFITNFLVHFVNLLSYAILIYLNTVVLVPLFLNNKNFWEYVFLVILAIILITPIRIFLQICILRAHESYYLHFVDNWSFLAITDFIIMIASSLYSIISDWIKKQREITDLKHSQLTTEINFLRSQINPHFLFNTLNSIYALSLKKSDDAPNLVLKLSEIMRYMLYDCNDSFVELQKEIDYVQNYIDLEKIRHKQNLEIKIEKNGNFSDKMIAPLIINPFVENSFKHGVFPEAEMNFVHIKFEIVNNNHFRFFIKNSKKETPKHYANKKSGGIGLKNVKRRLEIIYQNNYILNIEDKKDFYSSDLIINLN